MIKPWSSEMFKKNYPNCHGEPCAICGKEIKNKDKAIWLAVVYNEFVAPDTDEKTEGYQGGFPIGACCWRKHPELHKIRKMEI